MTVSTFYVGFNLPFWVDVAAELANEADWQPTHWVGRADLETDVREKFPQVSYYPLVQTIRGNFPSENPEQPSGAIDQPFLRSLSGIQVDTLKMMDRMSVLGSFNYHGRERLYYRQLMYWRGVIERQQPDLVVFSTIPHLIYDYVIYALCQHYGIRTVMFESTPMRGLVFMMDRFDGESTAVKLYQKMLADPDAQDVKLRPETEAYLNSLKGSYDQVPDYMRRTYKEEMPGRQRATLGTTIQKLFNFPSYGRYIEKQRSMFAQKRKPPRSYQVIKGRNPETHSISRWNDTVFRWRAKQYMRKVEATYCNLATPVDLGKPFIYVGMSYQPERTSSPMAGVYVNQLLMVDLLAKTVPEGWMVYVKEHPAQFMTSNTFRSQSGRVPALYEDMAATPNVRLAAMTTSSFDLTDHARAVATVTGSVGWEALNRGKPVLLFGHPWYRGCEGTFRISSQEDCVNAFRQIESGFQMDPQKLRMFVHAIEQVGIEGYVEPHLKIAPVTEKENVALIASSLREYWETASMKDEPGL